MKKLLTIILFISIFVLAGCTEDIPELTDLDDIGSTIDTTDTSEDLTENEITDLIDNSFFALTEKTINLDKYYEDYLLDDYELLTPNDSYTITESGVYVLEGNYTQTIIIDVDNEDVDLILNNVNVISTSGPAILVLSADDVTISALEGTINTIADSTIHPENEDLEDYNAAIYSKSDIVFNGSGTINIEANYNNAINCRDDIKILEVTLNITSVDDGIVGKDSISVKEATITIDSIGDSMVSSNEEDIDKGYIYIESGVFNLVSETDAIQAINDILIYDGTFTIDSFDNGIQSDSTITIGGGEFDINSDGDAVNSTLDLVIYDGVFTINAGDDGLHADVNLTIDGGTITIENSYEGIEALNIFINGGTITVTSTDDGINSTAGGGQEHGPQYVSTGGTLTITGGIILVSAQADGVDVNGSATMSDGYLIIYGPTLDSQSAIDYDVSFEISGGTVVSLGSTGMILPLSSSSTQASLIYADTTSYSAGTTVTLQNDDGETLISIVSLKSFTGAVISSPDMTIGETYTIEFNNDDYDFTISNIVTSLGDGGTTQGGGMPPRR